MNWYQFWDKADAFVETDAWIVIKGFIYGTIILIGVIIVLVRELIKRRKERGR